MNTPQSDSQNQSMAVGDFSSNLLIRKALKMLMPRGSIKIMYSIFSSYYFVDSHSLFKNCLLKLTFILDVNMARSHLLRSAIPLKTVHCGFVGCDLYVV